MSFLRHLQRLVFIDHLITKHATGSPKTFASKNKLSRSSLFNILKEMKELGLPLKYNKNIESYYYERNGKSLKEYFVERNITIIPYEELKEIGKIDPDNLCFSELTIFEKCE